MPKQATYKVIQWENAPESVGALPLDCDHCGREAMLPVAMAAEKNAIAANGLSVVFDRYPEPGWMPDIVQCRKCRHVFELHSKKETRDVR